MTKRVPHIVLACQHGFGDSGSQARHLAETYNLHPSPEYGRSDHELQTPSGRTVRISVRGIAPSRDLVSQFPLVKRLEPHEVESADMILVDYHTPETLRPYGREDLIQAMQKAKVDGKHFPLNRTQLRKSGRREALEARFKELLK